MERYLAIVLWLSSTVYAADDAVISSNGDDEGVCGLWFAESSIPGAGLGMYAGKTFNKGAPLLPTGDLVVPLIDMQTVQEDFTFLWDEYTWDADAVFMRNEGHSVDGASFGFGAAVNCFLDLTNVNEGVPEFDSMQLHRSKDIQAGAMTNYRNRQAWAKHKIEPGAELFASYGDNWFHLRAEDLPPVPLTGHLIKGNAVILRYRSLLKRYNNTEHHRDILRDAWEKFVWKNPFNDTSRVLFAIPKTWEEINDVMKSKSLKVWKRKQHSRSLEWVIENGVCGDNLKEGPSDLAVRGAIATRDMAKDSIVAPFPMIHIPYKRHIAIKSKRPRPIYQQLLNYCMGHKDTTMILCPYATLTALINHNKTLANVKLRWADPARSNHHPEWLEMTPRDIDKAKYAAGLAMELVATRDIKRGEEVLLDYGDDWEQAWKRHVETWKPSPDVLYVSGKDLQAKEEHIRTSSEEPYPFNIEIQFNMAFMDVRKWMPHWERGTLEQYSRDQDEYRKPCVVTDRTMDEDLNIWYSGYLIRPKHKKGKSEGKFSRVPREAFILMDKKYTTDVHLPHGFRHPIGIPDELLPDAWKNAATEGDPEPEPIIASSGARFVASGRAKSEEPEEEEEEEEGEDEEEYGDDDEYEDYEGEEEHDEL